MSTRTQLKTTERNRHSRYSDVDVRTSAVANAMSVLPRDTVDIFTNAGFTNINWDSHFSDIPTFMISLYHESISRATLHSDYFEECVEYVFDHMSHRILLCISQYGVSPVRELVKQIVHDLYVETDSVRTYL